jgi:hypothetical protein
MLPIIVAKSSDEIYKWLPKEFSSHHVIDFEDAKIDTHFWYKILPYISTDKTLTEALNKKPVEKLLGAAIIASVWDGVGSASLPTFISKSKEAEINSFAVAILRAH